MNRRISYLRLHSYSRKFDFSIVSPEKKKQLKLLITYRESSLICRISVRETKAA